MDINEELHEELYNEMMYQEQLQEEENQQIQQDEETANMLEEVGQYEFESEHVEAGWEESKQKIENLKREVDNYIQNCGDFGRAEEADAVHEVFTAAVALFYSDNIWDELYDRDRTDNFN